MGILDDFIGKTRAQIFKDYEGKLPMFRATTRPYKSKLPWIWTVVQALPAGGPFTVAFAKLLRGQSNDYFGFGLQTPIAMTTSFNKQASDADTNLSTARNTNGQEDFVIESISASCPSIRSEYASNDARVAALALTDPDIVAAFLGQRYLVDPGTLINPPQASSPFNLEDAMFEGFKSVASVQFSWDRTGFIPIGTLDQVPEGASRSLLKASGDPNVANRYKVPEGYAWRRKSMPDCDFVAKVSISDTVVCPINLIAPAGQGTVASVPLNLYQDVLMRVHGVGLTQISQNT